MCGVLVKQFFCYIFIPNFKKDFIYLFLESEGKGGRKKGRETLATPCMRPDQGPNSHS